MADFLSPEYKYLWALLLAAALFFPVRNLIHRVSVRRAQRWVEEIDPDENARLKKRAGVISAVICCGFSLLYTVQMVEG